MSSMKRTPECVEFSDSPSTSLDHRQRVVRNTSQNTGLGPIDLVWVRKRARLSFGEQNRDFFHHVVGYDVTSTASAAAYFAGMCSAAHSVCPWTAQWAGREGSP
jgi:hypothetical protein